MDDRSSVRDPHEQVIAVGVVVDEDSGDRLGLSSAGAGFGGQDLVTGFEAGDGDGDPAGEQDLAGTSTIKVDDGVWHHAVLTAGTSSQTLTLDGVTQQTLSGATSFQFSPANLAFGAGYIGSSWPAEPNYQKTGSGDYRYYLNGEIADITYSYPGGP